MKLIPSQTVDSLAKIIGASYAGRRDHKITGLNEIHKVETGDLVFVDVEKYYDIALNSAATTILINKKIDCPDGKALIFSNDPVRDFNILTRHFMPFQKADSMMSATAKIGAGTLIQPNVFIGNHVRIGMNCLLHAGATIYDHTEIGDNVIIHPNAVIGSDAFYFKKRSGCYEKYHACGNVVIEDDAEIGAGCTIDRGVTGDTRIGAGTKIDNLVQIGHDTVIGKNCLIAAQVGIAGAVVIEDDVTLWGQVGVPSNVRIGKGAVILAQSGITKSLEGGKVYFGSPAEENRKKLRELALIRKIPILMERL